MAHVIWTLKRSLTDAQIGAMYEFAEKLKIGISLYGNTPSPARDSFTWQINGSILRVIQFTRHIDALTRPVVSTSG
jgi:hypothetical protein